MNISLAFARTFFLILSIFFMTTYMMSLPDGVPYINAMIGIGLGLVFGFLLVGFDLLFKRFNLRSFNIAIIGLFFGFLMGEALVLILKAILDISVSIHISPIALEIIKIALFIFGLYLGTIMTLRSSDELYVSIPFVRFSQMAHKKKDIILDSSTLSDTRVIDFSALGLVDHHLIIPRFIVKDLYAQAETSEEMIKAKAKRSLDTLKKLEELPDLELRYNDTDFPEIADQQSKIIRLARLLDSNILTADISRIQIAAIEGVRIINLNSLSNALKPLMQAGEIIDIKVQRYGKEPRQGVGYLEDGTMVVVNGGGDYIGDTIKVQVLSVKHTSSGRMIFCNTLEGNYPEYNEDDYSEDDE
jgi:uncharacterized protein YacL